MSNSYITTITSTANEKIKSIRALALKKHRDAEGLFIIEGIEPVQKAFAHGWQAEALLFTEEGKKHAALEEVICRCQVQKAALYEVTEKVAAYATHRDNAQGVIGVFTQKYHHMDACKKTSGGIWLGLENIRDPGNLGTIIRTADAVSALGIMLIGHTCDPFAPEVVRASAGSFPAVPLAAVSVPDFLGWRKGFTGTVIGTHLHQRALDYRALPVRAPVILLMGSEQSGLSDELSSACDLLAKIPMQAGIESLNLAVSTGIMLYELSRNRQF